MRRRIALASQKGGVGKTTICLNLAVALAESQRRTLLVDLDPQGGIGLSLLKGETEWTGLAELLMGETTLDKAVVQTSPLCRADDSTPSMCASMSARSWFLGSSTAC